MTVRTRVASIIGAGMLALSLLPGAVAQTSVPVDVVVGVPANSALTWNLQQDGGFSAVTSSITDTGTSSGQLTLTVEDTRFTRQGWAISVSASDFVGAQSGESIPVGNFSLAPGAVTKIGDQTLAPVPASIALNTDAQMVLGASAGSGSGRYTLPMTGTVTVPANVKADTYKTSITVTASTAP